MKRTLITIAAILSFVILAAANPGDLDPTFNGTGKATANFGTGTAKGRASAIQADGKTIVAGYYQEPGITAIAIVRYNTNGSLDTSFDGDGKVTTAITNNALFAFAVGVQNDGKILVAGVSSLQTTFFVARYNTDGSPDTTFDTDGIAFTPNIGAYDSGTVSLAIQADGKIVVAGTGFFSGSGYDFCVARFNANGSLDTTFDADGIVNTSTTPNWDYGNAVAIQADGKIVVAGQSRNDIDGWDQISVVRYNSNGSLDTAFDGDGKLTTAVGSRSRSDGGKAIAVQSDNKIVVAGFAYSPSTGTDFALLRFNADGSPDATFDADGKVMTTIAGSSNDEANSIVIQQDGKIVAAGRSIGVGNSDFAFVRYNADGSLDNSAFAETNAPNAFGSGGKVTVDFAGGSDIPYNIALDSFGRIIAAGESGNSFGTLRLQGFAPTAANLSVSGRVFAPGNQALRNAVVYLTEANGTTRATRTGTFGFYRFDDIPAGQTVIVSVVSKRYQFSPRIVSINENLSDVDFAPLDSESSMK